MKDLPKTAYAKFSFGEGGRMNPRRNYYASFALIPVLILIALPDVVHAKSVYVIGDEEHRWDEADAVLEGMDAASRPGWIRSSRLAHPAPGSSRRAETRCRAGIAG